MQMPSKDEHHEHGKGTERHATGPTISPSEYEAQQADEQAMELTVDSDDQVGTPNPNANETTEPVTATPYLGTFEIPAPDSSQQQQDLADEPTARIFFPAKSTRKDITTGVQGHDSDGFPPDFRDDGPAQRAYTRQVLQAQHFRSISDTTSIVAVLIAALPWSLLSQPVVPATNFAGPTTFTFAALSSALSVILALLCQFAKLLYTLRPPGKRGFRTTMLAYILEDVAQLALLQLGLVAVLFFFLCMAAYSLVVGYIFVAITALAILVLTGWWIFVFVAAMQKAYQRFQAKADEMDIPPAQRRGLAVWRRVLFSVARPSSDGEKVDDKDR